MYVEFIGLPGAGKTTLRRQLLAVLGGGARFIAAEEAFLLAARENIDRVFRIPLRLLPRSMARRLSGKLLNRSIMQHDAQNLFLARHGQALQAFMGSPVFDGMRAADRQRVIGSFLETGSYWQCVQLLPAADRVVFFEEGLVQKSFMFVDYEHPGTDCGPLVTAYLEAIPQPDLVIHVTTSLPTSWERMLGRADGLTERLKDADDQSIRMFLEQAGQHLGIVANWLRQHREAHYLEVNGEADFGDGLDAIADRVRKLVG